MFEDEKIALVNAQNEPCHNYTEKQHASLPLACKYEYCLLALVNCIVNKHLDYFACYTTPQILIYY